MRMLFVFPALWSVLYVIAADISETACPAKCGSAAEVGLVSEIAKEIIHDEYLSGEEQLLEMKDEGLDKAEDWLLDEEILNDDIQADVEEGKGRLHDLIDEADTTKVVADSKNILTSAVEWFDNVDLTAARSDADAEISNVQAYINNYKSIKDDFVQDNLIGLLEDYISLGSEYVEENHITSATPDNESMKPKTDGRRSSSRGKRAKSRLKAVAKALRNQYDDDYTEKKEYYEGLKDKYQEDIDDLKLKKEEWREWTRSWRVKEEENFQPDSSQE